MDSRDSRARGGRSLLARRQVHLELLVVNDKARCAQFASGSSMTAAELAEMHRQTIHVVNLVASLYSGAFSWEFTIVLVGQEDWTASEPISVAADGNGETDAEDLLDALNAWRGANLATLPQNDVAHLFSGGTLTVRRWASRRNRGISPRASATSANTAAWSGVRVGISSPESASSRRRTAFGAATIGRRAPSPRYTRMNSARPPRRWRTRSDTSSGFSTTARLARTATPRRREARRARSTDTSWRRSARPGSSRRGRRARRRLSTTVPHFDCLRSGATAACGNGIVDMGEECDCGPDGCDGVDPCCDGATCQLTAGSECSETQGCCSSCRVVAANTMCRASTAFATSPRCARERRRSVPRTRVSRWGRRAWRITAIRARAGERRARTASGRVSDGGRTAASLRQTRAG